MTFVCFFLFFLAPWATPLDTRLGGGIIEVNRQAARLC